MCRRLHYIFLCLLLSVPQLVAEDGLIAGDVVRFWDGASQEEGTITDVTVSQYKILTDSGYTFEDFDDCVKVSHIGMATSDLVIAIGDLNDSQLHTSTQVISLRGDTQAVEDSVQTLFRYHLDGRGPANLSDEGFSGYSSSDYPMDEYSLLNIGFGAYLNSSGEYLTSSVPDLYSGVSQNDFTNKNLGIIAIPNNEGAHIIYQSMALMDANGTLVDVNGTLVDINSTLADLLEFFPLELNASVGFPDPLPVQDDQLANVLMDTANLDDILDGVVDLNQAVDDLAVQNHMDLQALDDTLGDEFDAWSGELNATFNPSDFGEAVADAIFAEGDARNADGQLEWDDHVIDADDAVELIDTELDSAEAYGLAITPSTTGMGSLTFDVANSAGVLTSYDLFDNSDVGVSVGEYYGWVYGIFIIFAYYMYWSKTKDLFASILKTSCESPDTAPISNHLSIAGCSELNIGLKVTQNLGYLAALLAIFAAIVTGVSAMGGFTWINAEIATSLGETTWSARAFDFFCTLVPVATILTLTVAYYSVAAVAWTGFFGSVRVSRSLS